MVSKIDKLTCFEIYMYVGIRYFSDTQSTSYTTWIFNLLEYFGKKIIPLTKDCDVPYKTIHFKFISANNTKKTLLYVIKHIAWVQVSK